MHATGTGEGFWGLLTVTERKILSDLGRQTTFPRRTMMCVEGEPDTYVFIILDGWVKIFSVSKDGHEIVLALRGHGDIVGEIAGETTGYRTATMQAIEAVRALIIRYDRFGSFLDSNSGADRAFRHVMTQRWSDATMMLRIRPVTTGAERLARLLLDLAERHGTQKGDEIKIAMPLSQNELASLAGAARATVTRAYSNWRRDGLIRTGQRQITISDVPGLRRIAASEA